MTANDNPMGVQGGVSGAAAGALMDAFVKTPGVGVAIVSAEGEILWENEEIRSLYLDAPHVDFVGQRIADLFPREWIEERLRIIRRVAETGEGAALREVWRGRQFIATFRAVPGEVGEAAEVLVISRPVEGTDVAKLPDGVHRIESAFVELGELASLTPRELVVLALLGQGLTLKEIAAKLHRSFKTVDNHRSSIGRKLHQTDRLMLAKLAAQAGLRVDDAQLERVKFKPPRM